MAILLNTRLVPIPGIPHPAGGGSVSPLGLLAPLTGTWKGNGFNQIWRPMNGGGSDNFLELNLTDETLAFTEIPGEIPNRGFAQADISLFGLTYLQQVSDANVKDTNGNPAGIHIEPGLWINIPATTDPNEPATVARLGNVPHGTTLLAQGTAIVASGAPVFAPVDITPFQIGDPANRIPFPGQTTLTDPSPFRSPPADIVGITQAMVDNPNSALEGALAGKTINSTTVIQISTISGAGTVPDAGGGTANIAFLDGTGTPNAHVPSLQATFWISDFTEGSTQGTLLQYSQLVLLNFNGLSWPHVSVASLIKQESKSTVKDIKDHKIEIKEHKEKPEIKEHKIEIKEIKEVKHEIKEVEQQLPQFPPQRIGPDPGPGSAGPAAAAPAEGRHFIAPGERPEVAADPKAAGEIEGEKQ